MTKKKKSRKLWIWLVLIAILAFMAGGYFYNKKGSDELEVLVEKSKINSIDEVVTGSGKIFPETEIKISSDVSGEIVELYVQEGDSVKTGQLLAKIDPEAYLSSVSRGEASLNNAKAQRSMALAQVEGNRAQKAQIQAQLNNARQIHDRNTDLKDQGVISISEWEASLSSLQGLEANLRASDSNILSSKESVNAAEFTIKSSEASLRELKTSLSRTTLKSPVDGVVSLLNVEKGERVVGTIQMTGTELMRIANLSAMEVQVEISENNILKVELGDSVQIEVDAFFDRIFKGEVTEIANTASNAAIAGTSSSILSSTQVTNFIVKIRIDPNSYTDLIKDANQFIFRPGMSATVDIFTNRVEGVLTVPIQSVTARENEDEDKIDEVVFVMQGDTVNMVKVKTSIQDDNNIYVTDGLTEGVEVVTGPYTILTKEIKQGSKVRIKNDKDE